MRPTVQVRKIPYKQTMRIPLPFALAAVAILVCAPPFARAAQERSLCEDALRAAGIESRAEIERHLSRFERLCEVARIQVSQDASSRERAAVLLACLHKEVLTGPYNPNLWNVADTLDNGSYNCLTATILYFDLCERLEISVSAVSQPGHLLCRVEGNPPFLVETTCSRWFELSAPAAFSSEGRVLGRAEILAKVHYNRALALLAEDRFAAALACLRTSRRLDPLDNAARENEAAALHNWSIRLADEAGAKKP